jgi:hypothetical protein
MGRLFLFWDWRLFLWGVAAIVAGAVLLATLAILSE